MGASDAATDHTPSAPTWEGEPCFICKELAAKRCEACSPADADAKLYLCENKACFKATHNEFNAKAHEDSLVAWNSKQKWKDQCCGTHKGKLLELWCLECSALMCDHCLSHGAHKKHDNKLIIDIWKEKQGELKAKAERLRETAEACTQQLRQLDHLRMDLKTHAGQVEAVSASLDAVQKAVVDKVAEMKAVLRRDADAFAEAASEEHDKTEEHLRELVSLAEKMDATSGEQDAGECQRVVLEHVQLSQEHEGIAGMPPAFDCKFEVTPEPLAALMEAVAAVGLLNTTQGSSARTRANGIMQ